MDVLILRLIHIVAGAFWVGALFTNVLFLTPTAIALGPDAGKFQFHLIRGVRFPLVMLSSAIITVLAGIWLLWITTDGLKLDLLFSPSRVGFTLGGIVAILTLGVGGLYIYPRIQRVATLMSGPMGEGRPPTPDEQAQLLATRGELLRSGWVVLTGVAIAVVFMATARYWSVFL